MCDCRKKGLPLMKLILYFVHEVEIFRTIFEKTETAM